MKMNHVNKKLITKLVLYCPVREILSPIIKTCLLVFLVFILLSSTSAQNNNLLINGTIDKRDLQASPRVRSILKELRREKISKGWTFDQVYTPVMERDIPSLTGGKVPPNFRQFVIDQNVKAAARLKTLRRVYSGSQNCNAQSRTFDWRKMNGVSPVKDQGGCGSCWDFAAHAILESSWLIANKTLINSSEQSTLDCISGNFIVGGDDCGGGWVSDALDFMQNTGSANTTDYPYTGVKGACLSAGFPYKLDAWGYVGEDDDIPSIEKIKEAICYYGPVASYVYVSPAFQSYGGGVFNERSSNNTNHVVSIVGWDDDKSAWLVKNSWGSNWGSNCEYGDEKGYIWINYYTNSIGQGAAWALAQQTQIDTVAGIAMDTIRYMIKEPIVNRSICIFDGTNASPQIIFKPGDKISITAGGCEQTGGWGATWKRYVNPEGDNTDKFYYCVVQIPGVTQGIVPLRGTGGYYDPSQKDKYTVNFATVVPDNIPSNEQYLKLGFTDDNYSDNGYYGHDDGNNDQCRYCGNAYFKLTILRPKTTFGSKGNSIKHSKNK